ncbi:MAG: acyl carrier protein [Clostridia bacterium]|nr:acyl carrier protein [Clostridia bacterium]
MQKFAQLVELLENYVEVDEIKAEDNFKLDLGMSSFDTMCLVNDIMDTFGVELKATDFVNYKTVGEMAEYLDSIC